MKASWNGHHEVVLYLLEHQANVNAKDNVRNQMIVVMIIIIIIIIKGLTIMIKMMMVIMIVVIYNEDGDDCS
jgi:hypothetical protein